MAEVTETGADWVVLSVTEYERLRERLKRAETLLRERPVLVQESEYLAQRALATEADETLLALSPRDYTRSCGLRLALGT